MAQTNAQLIATLEVERDKIVAKLATAPDSYTVTDPATGTTTVQKHQMDRLERIYKLLDRLNGAGQGPHRNKLKFVSHRV